MSKIFFSLAFLFLLLSAALGVLNYQKFVAMKGKFSEAQETMVQQEHLIDGMTKELEEAKASLAKQEEQSKKMDQLQKEHDQAVKDLTDAKKKISDQEAYLKQQQDDIASRDKLIMELQEQKDAPASTQDSDKGKKGDQKPKPRDGKVLAVNDAWNFIVVNLGSQHGLKEGEEVVVEQEGDVVGKARLSSIEPLTSVADIIPSSTTPGQPLKSGDQVLFGDAATAALAAVPTPAPTAAPTATPAEKKKEDASQASEATPENISQDQERVATTPSE